MNTVLIVCSWVGIALMFAIGFGGLLATTKMADTQNIKVGGPLALGELRTALGSNFLVLASALVWLRSAELFLVVAALWTAATLVKLVSLVLDRPALSQALVGILFDAAMALLMLAGYFLYRV
ncbi:MAG TPA: hypothetical protein VLC91_10345 [Spongiibacteraceae bacterium]|nr:hypothetical protein [Spongiibacteraceae bacterium]